jgi:cytochrome c oxidase subunit 4
MHDGRGYPGGALTFVAVWIALLVFTALTVAVAEMHSGRTSVLFPLLIASAKASLVLWYFMHLKEETRLFKLLLLMPIVTLTVIIGLTFVDLWFR